MKLLRHAVVFASFALGLLVAPGRGQTVRLEGGFGPTAENLDPEHAAEIGRHTRLWDSWQNTDDKVGRLVYGPFQVGSTVELWVNGFPNTPDERIYLERVSDLARLRLSTRSPPGGAWTNYRWSLPPGWSGSTLRLIAEDVSPEANHWIGVSAPLKPSWHLGDACLLVARVAAIFGLLLLPGGAALSLCRQMHPLRGLLAVLVFSGIVSHAMVFAYLAGPAWGQAASWCAMAGSLALVTVRWRRLAAYLASPEFSTPLAFAALAALFYVTAGFLYGGLQSPDAAPLMRFFPELAPDPLLPQWFAQRLALGQPIRPFFLEWLTSDRPPLQTGMSLLLWPWGHTGLDYEGIGVSAQSWVWVGLWIFFRSFQVGGRSIAVAMAAALASGFFFANTFYCWPKLLPAAFLLAVAGLILGSERRQVWDEETSLLIFSSLALALLAHGGSGFGILALAPVCLWRRPKLRLAHGLLGLAAMAGLLLPWQMYQRFEDPPGDRLIKYHLAGRPDVDPRPSGTVLREAYRAIGWSGAAKNKADNLRYLFAEAGEWFTNTASAAKGMAKGRFATAYRSFSWDTRRKQFLFYWIILGPASLGLLGLIGCRQHRRNAPERRAALAAGGLALANILVWCLLMFSWGSTAVQNSSYFLAACLFATAGMGLARCPRWFAAAVLGLNFLWFFGVWILTSQRSPGSPYWYPSSIPGYWLVGCVVLTGLAACLARMSRLGRPTDLSCAK